MAKLRMEDVPIEERRRLDKDLRAKGYGDDIKQSKRKKRDTSKIIKGSSSPGAEKSFSSDAAAGNASYSYSRKNIWKQPPAAKPKKKPAKKKSSKSVFAQINIFFILKFYGVVKLSTGSFSYKFMKKFYENYSEALRILKVQHEVIEAKAGAIDTLLNRLGSADEEQIQALLDLLDFYDDEFTNQFADKFYDDPEKNIIAWEKEVVSFYAGLYEIRPFRDEICILMKNVIKYVSTYAGDKGGDKTINARDVDVYFKTIFETLYIRIHWLFCYYAGVKLDIDDPDIKKYISSLLTTVKKSTKKKKTEPKPEKVSSENEKKEKPLSAAEMIIEEQVPDSLDDIEGINNCVEEDYKDEVSEQDSFFSEEDCEEDPLLTDAGKSYFINCYNTPSSIMERTTNLFDINHRCDKVLHISFIFKKFIEQFSFIFITNKIKYSNREIEYKMRDYYNQISRFENDMARYFELVESYHDTYSKEVSTKEKNYVSSAGRIDSIDKQRQNSGTLFRSNLLLYLRKINDLISAIIEEKNNERAAISEIDTVIKFDGKVEKDKIVNNHSICEAFIIIRAFNELFVKELNSPGSLSGTISLYDELPSMADSVKERLEMENAMKEKAEIEREERDRADGERDRKQREELDKVDSERAEKETEERERAELEKIEREKNRAKLDKLNLEKQERDNTRILQAERDRQEKLNAINELIEKEKKEKGNAQNNADEKAVLNSAVEVKNKNSINDASIKMKQEANSVNSINYSELWQKAVREKIVIQDRAVNEYIDIGSARFAEAALSQEGENGESLNPSAGKNSTYTAAFKPYLNYKYQDVVRRVMEFEIVLSDFIKEVLISRYEDRWQQVIARSNIEIKKMLDRENAQIMHRGIEYNILEMLNLGQKFSIMLNDALWGDFKVALGIDKTEKSEKTIFQKRSSQIVSLRNDVMHLKTVDSTSKEIGFGAISEISDWIKKYSFRKRKSENDRKNIENRIV